MHIYYLVELEFRPHNRSTKLAQHCKTAFCRPLVLRGKGPHFQGLFPYLSLTSLLQHSKSSNEIFSRFFSRENMRYFPQAAA